VPTGALVPAAALDGRGRRCQGHLSRPSVLRLRRGVHGEYYPHVSLSHDPIRRCADRRPATQATDLHFLRAVPRRGFGRDRGRRRGGRVRRWALRGAALHPPAPVLPRRWPGGRRPGARGDVGVPRTDRSRRGCRHVLPVQPSPATRRSHRGRRRGGLITLAPTAKHTLTTAQYDLMTPTTEQDAPVAQPFWLRTIALGVLLFALQTVDVVRLTVNMVSVSSLAWLFIAALITASALGWAVLNSRWHGWRL